MPMTRTSIVDRQLGLATAILSLMVAGCLASAGKEAVAGRTAAKSVNAVSAKQHRGGAFILRGSEIRDPGSRGVWMHVGSRMYTLGNLFYGGGMTIDFDAFCFRSAALFNTVSGNTYHSAIFFEEAVKFNTAFANHLDIGKDECNGIAFHNQNVKGTMGFSPPER